MDWTSRLNVLFKGRHSKATSVETARHDNQPGISFHRQSRLTLHVPYLLDVVVTRFLTRDSTIVAILVSIRRLHYSSPIHQVSFISNLCHDLFHFLFNSENSRKLIGSELKIIKLVYCPSKNKQEQAHSVTTTFYYTNINAFFVPRILSCCHSYRCFDVWSDVVNYCLFIS